MIRNIRHEGAVGPGRSAELDPRGQTAVHAGIPGGLRGEPGRHGDGAGGVVSQYCFPQGMPMMMNIYDPMEIVVTANVTYILISHVNDAYRRIYTDGRDWPKEDEFVPTHIGYSIGKWVEPSVSAQWWTLFIRRSCWQDREYCVGWDGARGLVAGDW
jgi:hypothetical protein